jgi:hypothetical protein
MSNSTGDSAPRDLLSTAYRLTGGQTVTWVGTSRSSGSNQLSGWQWVDGTSPSNIRATSMGDGIWAAGEPNNAPTGPVRGCLRAPYHAICANASSAFKFEADNLRVCSHVGEMLNVCP